MNSKQKNVILNTYDDICDTLPHISELFLNVGWFKKNIVGNLTSTSIQKVAEQHETLKKVVLVRANKVTTIPTDLGMAYIDSPDVRVQTEVRGQCKPGSLENYVFFAPVFEHYFELREPELSGYLDKGLVAIALRIRKVMIAPGIYKAVVEEVPIFLTVYNEMLKKYIDEFVAKFGRYPNETSLRNLKSKAMAAVCDRKYSDGHIEEVDSMHNLYASKLDSILNNPNSRLVTNWPQFKREIESTYGISWRDNYTSKSGKTVNIWGDPTYEAFDNRKLILSKTR